MKRIKLHLPRLSRPQRIVWNLFVSLLLLVFIWWTFGCPLPLMTQFRLAEKKMLVGPSEILDIVSVDMENGRRARMLIAESKYGYSVYSTRILENLVGVSSYIYREKQENVNLITPNNFGGIPEKFPLILFTGLPAARAEVRFELGPDILNDLSMTETRTYCLESEPQPGGYFLFLFEPQAEDEETQHAELVAMNALAYWSQVGYSGDVEITNDAYRITVRLWDAQGQLIYEKDLLCGLEVNET